MVTPRYVDDNGVDTVTVCHAEEHDGGILEGEIIGKFALLTFAKLSQYFICF